MWAFTCTCICTFMCVHMDASTHMHAPCTDTKKKLIKTLTILNDSPPGPHLCSKAVSSPDPVPWGFPGSGELSPQVSGLPCCLTVNACSSPLLHKSASVLLPVWKRFLEVLVSLRKHSFSFRSTHSQPELLHFSLLSGKMLFWGCNVNVTTMQMTHVGSPESPQN